MEDMAGKGGAEFEQKVKDAADGDLYEDPAKAKPKTADQLTQEQAIADVENGTTKLSDYGEKTGNYTRKGNYGAMKADAHFENLTDINGNPTELNRISADRTTGIDQKGHQGIDGVYENAHPPPKYIVSARKLLQSFTILSFSPKNSLNKFA